MPPTTLTSYVTLTRIDSDQTLDLDWAVASPPDPTKMWQLNLDPGASLKLNYVLVKYSDARSHPVALTANVDLYERAGTPPQNYTYLTCYEWIFGILAVYSYAEDSDGNGKIDRIRVIAQTPLNGIFSQFTATVNSTSGVSYAIDTSKGEKGYQMVPAAQTLPGDSGGTRYGGLGFEFFIYLVEKPYNDTGTTLAWTIVNISLEDSQNTLRLYTIASAGGEASTPMYTIDTAAPRIAYTLALPGAKQVFYHFSEPVYATTSDGPISSANFTGASSLAAITKAADGVGVSEALVSYPSAISAATIASGTEYSLAAPLYDYMPSTPPDDYATDPQWTNFWLSLGGLPPHVYNLAAGAASWPTPIASLTHRVSDLLVNVPISSTTDPTYFVWPVYAKDSVNPSLSDATIANQTPAQTASEGIGLIRAFDGSQWLRAQDITVQARVQPTLAPNLAPALWASAGLRLWFDTNVPSTLTSSGGLWLPTFLESGFSGLVPYPNAPTWGRGASPTQAGKSVGTNLYDLAIPKSDPRIVSVSNLGFYFTFDAPAGEQPLYAARLDIAAGAAIPSDWYKRIKPFAFSLHNVTLQKGGATILNNVIDPTKGQTARLSYQLPQDGSVTVTVFTLDGDVVARLVNATQAAGDYSVSWNGRNLAGNPVARGLYFVRIVAPGMDEIRKVLVVRN